MAEDLFGDIPAAPAPSAPDANDDLFGDIPEPTPAAPAAPSPARRWMADYGLRLYKAGYRPIPIKPGEKSPDMDGWQHLKHSSLSAFRAVPRDFPNAGIGILSFNTPGVDIDVKDAGLAAELDRLAAEMLGWAPVRVGMPPKRLRAYRCATPFRKIKPWQGWVLPGEEGAAALKGYKAHNVEILAEDNQFVAMGIHPDTHRPYLWEGRGLLDVTWDGLTLVTEESLLRFMEAAEEVFLRWGCKRIEEVRGGGLGGGCGVRGARLTSERGNLGASFDKARGALDGLPNADLHYDTWIKIGLILKGAFGDDGWALFDDWSAKSVKYSYEVTERAWDSLSPRGEVTIGTLYMMAEKATGWSFKEPARVATDEFEDVEVGVDFEVQEAKVQERQVAEKARRQAAGLGGETADGGGGKPALTPEEEAKKAAAAEKRKKAAEARRIEKEARMEAAEAERQRILEEAYPQVGDVPDEADSPGVEILPPQKKGKQPSQAVKANGDFWTLKTWKATMSRRGEDGEYHASHDNVMLALENIQDWYGMFSFDAMANAVLVTRPPPSIIQVLDEAGPGYPRPVTDQDAVAVARWFQRHGLNKLSPNTVQQCIDTVAHQHAFHPIRQYLNSLQWDGKPRLSAWVHRCLGTPDNEYNTAVGRMYLISMVARVFKPGCKADYVIILEGTQGKTKSTACSILAGEWFSDSVPVLGSKDSMEHLHGIWLAELAELSSMNKSDTESVKAFLTRRKDKYRPSYGRRSITAPRQCVFVGTTNKKQYLRDDTGSRRFWPIATGALDLDILTAERDQMFAEAVAAFNAGEHWWPDREFEERVIRPEQEARYESDAWEEGVAAFLRGVLDSIPENRALLEETRPDSRTAGLEAAAKGWTTVSTVAHEGLGLPVGRVGTVEVRRITPVMERLGWSRVRTAGARFWRYEGDVAL